MSLWRQLTRGVRVLTRRTAADRDVADEVRHYLEQSTAALIAAGHSPDEARRAAAIAIGNATVIREQLRGSAWEGAIDVLLADLRYAARRLRRQPGFTLVCAITLALGIGASTAIFSVVNPILFAPLPYPHAARIAMISDVGQQGTPADVTFGTYLELVQRSRSFEAAAVVKAWQPAMVADARPERLNGQRVSAGYFRALGVTPILGRDFEAVDDRSDGPRVIVLGDALWRRRFGADRTIVGREVRLDDTLYQVIGIMPPGFENVLWPSAEVWAPLQYRTVLTPDSREWGHHLRMVARLRAGMAIDQASRELAAIARAPLPAFPRVPWAALDRGLIVTSLQADVTRGVRPALLAVVGAVMLVLAIACVNVTNLLLARGAQRRGEFAMRAALGAGRSRLVGQGLTESVLLALAGGALGMIVAAGGVRAIVGLSPPGLPRLGAIRIDATVFAFAFGITTLVGLLVGVIPALQASREDLGAGLQHSSRRTAGGHQRTRGALVVAEVALALVLLVSAGLLMRSLERLFAVAIGFDSSRLLTLQLQAVGPQFDSDAARRRFFDRALDAVLRVPGVAAAAFTSQLPLSGDLDGYGLRFEIDHELQDTGSALRYAVTPGYLDAMRIPLRRGRRLDAHDAATAPRAALINESLARRQFADRDPLGLRFRFGPDEGDWYTVVGVVGDVTQTSLAAGDTDAAYVTPAQWHWVDNVMSLVVRARGDAAALAPAVREAIWSVDKGQPIVRVATMERLVARSEADRHFAMILFEAFGLVALALAATGIYGVLSGGVTERMQEIGVRSALGASRGSIVALVVGQGMALTALGVAMGIAGSLAASGAIVTLLFGVSRLDPITYLCVMGLLAAAAAIACGVPAWRAARVDPAITLRAD